MAGRILRVTETVLVIAVALVTPVLAASTPASADMVVDGCTIVSNPTPTHFTNCPNANLAGADLASVNLSYANLAGAQFVACFAPTTCTSASLSDANLTQANLSGASLSTCAFIPVVECLSADLTDALLSGADLSGVRAQLATFPDARLGGANLTRADLGGADLVNADLTGANLTGTLFSSVVQIVGDTVYATLTGANLTGTILVPSNQSVTATSQAGAVATWPTPAGVPGATPGSCTPASGSTFPLFSTTVTCQVLDNNGDVATGTFQVNVQPTTQYFTRVLLPSDGASLAGSQYLDAAASDSPGVTKVVFEVSGGTLSDQVIATATPTIYGWLAQWNTTTVPNGIYTLQSVATDADNNTDTSTPISVTVNNQPPVTAVLIPSNGATLSGSTTLDASASNATSVEFRLFGGIYGYAAPVLCTATLTYYGWLCSWNTTKVPSGSYVLVSEAFNSAGSAFSSGVSITVTNPPGLADLANSSFTYTASGYRSGCGIVYLTFDAVYPGSAAVGNVTLHIAGCVSDPYTYAGSFTITTGVGTLSGSAKGSITYIGDTLESSYGITLSVTTETGSFSGTTGSLGFSAPYQTPQVASLAVE
jgi:uncharacterized protein YjbI with pentapeptide repeats